VIKSRWVSWDGHVARIEIKTYIIFMESLNERNDNIKMNLKEIMFFFSGFTALLV
jgi:hypothetical protein